MVAVFAISVAVLFVLSAATGNLRTAPTDNLALLVAFAAFLAMGALIAAHRPGNPVGWIFTAIGLLAVTGALAEEYAYYAYVTRPGSLPGAIVAVWYAGWHWYLTISLTLLFARLLFPTGRLPSPRWRPVAWLAGLTTATLPALAAFQAQLPEIGGHVLPNPVGSPGSRTPRRAGSATSCSPSWPCWWCWRSPPWRSGSGGRGARNASSSSGSPMLPPSCPSCCWATGSPKRSATCSSPS